MRIYQTVVYGLILLITGYQACASNTRVKRSRAACEVVLDEPLEVNFATMQIQTTIKEERKVFQLNTEERDKLLANATKGDSDAQDSVLELYFEAAIGFSEGELIKIMESLDRRQVYEKATRDDHYAFFVLDLCSQNEKIKDRVLSKHRNVLINVNRRALLGQVNAWYNLGYLYLLGYVGQDYKFAAECFRNAAKQEHALSFCALAYMHSHGVGFEKNSTNGALLLSKAKRLGCDYADFVVARLDRNHASFSRNL